MHFRANSRYSYCLFILEVKKNYVANQINRAGNTLMTESHEII